MSSRLTSDQIILQLLEELRSAPLIPTEAAVLSLQLLAWAECSRTGRIEADLHLERVLEGGSNALLQALQQLESSQGLIGQAFTNAPAMARAASAQLEAVSTTAMRLANAGLAERFTPADVAARYATKALDQEAISPQLVEMMRELTFADEASTLYLPWDTTGQFMAEAVHDSCSIVVETPHRTSLPAIIALFRDASTTVLVADPLSSPSAVSGGSPVRFDTVLAFPPFGRAEPRLSEFDLYGRFPVGGSLTALAIQHVVAHAGGAAAIIVPSSFLYGGGADRDLRRLLVERRLLKAVIALPAGLIGRLALPFAVLVLHPGSPSDRVRFLDARNTYYASSKRGSPVLRDPIEISDYCRGNQETDAVTELTDIPHAVEVSIPEIEAQDFTLQVERFVVADDQRRLRMLLERAESIALDSVSTLISPVQNKDRGEPGLFDVAACEVGAADIPPFGYISEASREISIKLPPRKSQKEQHAVFLRPGDIVLVTKGNAGKVGIVREPPPPGPGGWICGQSAVVIRCTDTQVTPEWVALFLRSELGQALLKSVLKGAVIPVISLQDLKNLRLPKAPLHVAKSATAVLEQEEQLELEIRELRAAQKNAAEILWEDLLPAQAVLA